MPKDIENSMSDEKIKRFLKMTEGKLLYLNLSRPELAFKVNSVARLTKETTLKAKNKKART